VDSFREPAEVPLTRIEVLDFVGEAFDRAPVDRAALLDAASRGGARLALLDRLRELPDGPFAEPPDLWEHLPDVPVDLRRS
jgi:hypothetical protein